MFKKLLSLGLILMTLLGLMIPMFASAEVAPAGSNMWVNCADGRRLNVREAPNKGAKLLYRIESGKKVDILNPSAAPGWAYVRESGKNTCGYVMTKFLVESKPGKYEITERSDNFTKVASYTVTAKALNAKTTKSVGLRVSPNKTAKMVRRLQAGDQLTVLETAKTWSKVFDPLTGKTGYVANDYMIR